MGQRNQAQWPSFDNLSVWYARDAKRRVKLSKRRVTKLSKEQEQQQKQPMQDNDDDKGCLPGPKPSPAAEKVVFASEKIDGTNFGIRCDGVMFGRRMQLSDTETSYHKIPLNKSTVPDANDVMKMKGLISEKIGMPYNELPPMIVYGELLCNPSKFGYSKREQVESKTWLAFGIVIMTATASDNDIDNHDDLARSLLNNGFVVAINKEDVTHGSCSKVTLTLNATLVDVFQQANIPVTPRLDHGTLKDVCLRQKDLMMDPSRLEGLVITGTDGSIHKWKTGREDISKGYELLSSVQKENSPSVLEAAGVDVELLQCLIDVAGYKPPQPRKGPTAKQPPASIALYQEEELQAAYESALTKYDALDEYFAKNQKNMMVSNLCDEISADLSADTKDKKKEVNKFVNKMVGMAYGAWKRNQ